VGKRERKFDRDAVSAHPGELSPGEPDVGGSRNWLRARPRLGPLQAEEEDLLDRFERVGSPYRLTNIGSTQFRLEGIDALELHFRSDNGPESHQPRPRSRTSRATTVLGAS
jgi:hypothetical protein